MSLKRLVSLFAAALVMNTTLPAATDLLGNSTDLFESNICTFATGSDTCSVHTTLHGLKTLNCISGNPDLIPWAYSIVLAPPARYFGWVEWHVFILDGVNWIDYGALDYDPYDYSQTIVTAFQEDLEIRVTLTVFYGVAPAEEHPFDVRVWPSQSHPQVKETCQ